MNSVPTLQIPTWKSIYVPVIPHDLTIDGLLMTNEETLRDYFENKLQLGKIDRIDMVCRQANPQSGIVSTSAFVHFEHLNEDTSSLARLAEIENGDYKINGYMLDGQYQFFIRTMTRCKSMPFLSIKVNYKPLPTAVETMNVHQLVAAKTELEKKLKEMEAEIFELKSMLTLSQIANINV